MMGKTYSFKQNNYFRGTLYLLLFIGYFQLIPASLSQEIQSQNFKSFKGVVVDSKTRKPLEFAGISVDGTNISTVTNSDGGFLLKVPVDQLDNDVTIAFLGYYNKVIPLKEFTDKKNIIKLDESIVKLPEVSLTVKDPDEIIRKVIENRRKNYLSDPSIMTAFYRETIRKGRKRYASLSEAVVEIYKTSYSSTGNDYVKIYKARKSSDYRRLDTLLIKLQGGPYNTLNFDIMKNQNILFSKNVFDIYSFTFEKMLLVDNRPTYVINFKQYPSIEDPLYYGKLYIDANTFALSKAAISLNLENKKLAGKYFVKKKPKGAEVEPFQANYFVDYRRKGNKWFINYSRIELAFKIDYDKKWFNSNYYITVEMAVTDWKYNTEKLVLKGKERLRTNVILNDKVSGFQDPSFWGDYNVIEPDKPIENAIKKIRRQLERK